MRLVSLNRSGAGYQAEDLRYVRIAQSAVGGVSGEMVRAVVRERHPGGMFRSIEDAYDRLPLGRDTRDQLARAGGYATDRQAALYTRRHAGPCLSAGNGGAAGTGHGGA